MWGNRVYFKYSMPQWGPKIIIKPFLPPPNYLSACYVQISDFYNDPECGLSHFTEEKLRLREVE